MKQQHIQTDRLDLVPFNSDDAIQLLTVFQDAAVRRYLLDDQIVDSVWVGQEIEQSQNRFDAGSIGIWSVRASRTADQQQAIPIIGFVGFREFFDPPELQLIYGLVPAVWQRGYATEAAQAAIDYGFQAGLECIVAATDLLNTASAAVMKRLGMVKYRVTDDGDQGTVFYRLPRGG